MHQKLPRQQCHKRDALSDVTTRGIRDSMQPEVSDFPIDVNDYSITMIMMITYDSKSFRYVTALVIVFLLHDIVGLEVCHHDTLIFPRCNTSTMIS